MIDVCVYVCVAAEEDSNLVAIVAGSVGAVCCCLLCIVAVVVVVVCVIGSSSPSAQSGQVLAPIDSYNSNNTPVFDTQVCVFLATVVVLNFPI